MTKNVARRCVVARVEAERNNVVKVEPGSHFLGCGHTMANYETAFFDATLSDSESFEQWTERGSKDTAQRAFERWNRMLEEHQPPPLDEAINEALTGFVETRKNSMPDAWY